MIPTHQRTAVRNANLRAAPFFVSLPLYTWITDAAGIAFPIVLYRL